MSWLPDFVHPPPRVELRTGHHLRPIRESDVEIDYPAVMASRERLWRKYGERWGWPPEDMSFEDDRRDLARHEREMAARETWNYAVLNAQETELLGCVYVDPPAADSPVGSDAQVSWWVVDWMIDSELEAELGAFVPRWMSEVWGFSAVDYSP
jgi:hypothetical protein